ncbi:DNA-directed RNA polymerase I subunit RPA12 isoform X3 [Lutra lutra]|uniref:DNA-directed RNA polymerase I subunit RPA12 isoform X3 n=1 Tax=Lutra lutra TaxID=9657 RepID=UPI001FD01DD5|nr:DNA-directed RNA polymerase I subunit RPA12 isoform X3 [Lutra lutra]
MDGARSGSRFQSDLDFCPDCGSVLPLPGAQDTVTCVRCGFRVPVRDFEGKVVNTCVVFNKPGTAAPVPAEEGPEFQGPVVPGEGRLLIFFPGNATILPRMVRDIGFLRSFVHPSCNVLLP